MDNSDFIKQTKIDWFEISTEHINGKDISSYIVTINTRIAELNEMINEDDLSIEPLERTPLLITLAYRFYRLRDCCFIN